MEMEKKSKTSKASKQATLKTASSSASISTTTSILNLPDLEPRNIHKPISEDSVSSMSQSVTPDHGHYSNHNHHKKKNGKKRKLINNLMNKNGHSHKNKKRKLNNNKLKIIDNDVIGDSDEEEEEEIETQIKTKKYKNSKNKKNKHKNKAKWSENDEEEIEINKEDFKISHSLIYEITLDDFKFSFFLSLFPQLFVTHHLVYCQNSYKHYYYQNYFSSINNKYEWIQTDIQLMDIYHRYINNHFVKDDYDIINKHKYNDFKNRKIVLFFQIRPRSDTESDEESIEYHKQLLMDNLIQINEIRKNHSIQRHRNNQKRRRQRLKKFDDKENEKLFYLTNDDDTDNTNSSSDDNYNDSDIDNKYKSIYLNSSKQDIIYDNVIAEINSSHNNNDKEIQKIEIERSLSIIPGSTESGVCGLCEKKFSTNKCTEQEWIQCEFCNKWYHVICSGLTAKEFAKFQDQNDDTKEENKYKCLMCNKEE